MRTTSTTEAVTTTIKVFSGDDRIDVTKTTLHDTNDDNVKNDDSEVHELRIQCVTTVNLGAPAPSLLSDYEVLKAIQSVATTYGSVNPNLILQHLSKAGFHNCAISDQSPESRVGVVEPEDRIEPGM